MFYSLIATGMNVIFGMLDVINIAQGSLMILGAYTTYWLLVLFNVNPALSIFISAPLGFFVGIFVEKILISDLIKSAKSREIFLSSTMLITFGFSIFIDSMEMNFWKRDPRSYQFLTSTVQFFGASFMIVRLVVLMVSVIALVTMFYFFRKTYFGKAMRAASSDRKAAMLVGIPADKLDAITFGIGTALSFIAGSLFSMTSMFSPNSGFDLSIKGLCIIMLGGLGSIKGGVVGATILAFVEVTASFFISPIWGIVISYVILLILLLTKPSGLFT